MDYLIVLAHRCWLLVFTGYVFYTPPHITPVGLLSHSVVFLAYSLDQQTLDASPLGALTMRDCQLQREDKMHAERLEKNRQQHETKLKLLEIKMQQAQTDALKAEGTKSKLEMKVKEQEVKDAKAKLKAEAQQKRTQAKRKAQFLAAAVCSAIKKQNRAEGGSALWDTMKNAALSLCAKGKTVKAKHAVAPTFVETVIDWYKDISVLKIGSKKKSNAAVLASESFAWHLHEGDIEKLENPEPAECLRNLIMRSLPKYHTLLPYEYHAEALLAKNHHNVDQCYLEAVWRYSQMLGNDFLWEVDLQAVPASAAAASSSVEPVHTTASSSSASAPGNKASVPSSASSSNKASSSKPVPVPDAAKVEKKHKHTKKAEKH